jgi:hypothetical protein
MTREVVVADLRRIGLKDDAMDQFRNDLGFDFLSIEERRLAAPFGPQHGDMHGKNVLVDRAGHVMLIDFGDVERRPLGLDPVVLELSLIFHPDRPRPGSEPPVDACMHWADVDQFAGATAFPGFVKACRDWALQVAGERQVLCLTYAHAVRQLKYPETDKAKAVAVARAAAARLEQL